MRFKIGPVPENADFDPVKENWSGIKEPDPVQLQIIAIPVMVLTAVILILLLTWTTPITFDELVTPLFLVAFLIIIPVHELLHAAFNPHAGLSEQTTIGFWPAKFLFYSYYEGAMSRNRFIISLASPFIFLSLAPILLNVVLQSKHPLWGVVTFANGIASSGDLIGIALAWSQIPRAATVKNKGWKTYWKDSDNAAT